MLLVSCYWYAKYSIHVARCTCGPHHSAMVRIIKPLQQLHAGAFPTAAAANKGQSLARFHRHVQPIQDLHIGPGGVRELAVNEVNVSLEIILIKIKGKKKVYVNDLDCVHERGGGSQDLWLE